MYFDKPREMLRKMRDQFNAPAAAAKPAAAATPPALPSMRSAAKTAVAAAPIVAWGAMPDADRQQAVGALNPVLGLANALGRPVRESLESGIKGVFGQPAQAQSAKKYKAGITDEQAAMYRGTDGRDRAPGPVGSVPTPAGYVAPQLDKADYDAQVLTALRAGQAKEMDGLAAQYNSGLRMAETGPAGRTAYVPGYADGRGGFVHGNVVSGETRDVPASTMAGLGGMRGTTDAQFNAAYAASGSNIGRKGSSFSDAPGSNPLAATEEGRARAQAATLREAQRQEGVRKEQAMRLESAVTQGYATPQQLEAYKMTQAASGNEVDKQTKELSLRNAQKMMDLGDKYLAETDPTKKAGLAQDIMLLTGQTGKKSGKDGADDKGDSEKVSAQLALAKALGGEGNEAKLLQATDQMLRSKRTEFVEKYKAAKTPAEKAALEAQWAEIEASAYSQPNMLDAKNATDARTDIAEDNVVPRGIKGALLGTAAGAAVGAANSFRKGKLSLPSLALGAIGGGVTGGLAGYSGGTRGVDEFTDLNKVKGLTLKDGVLRNADGSIAVPVDRLDPERQAWYGAR